MQRESSFYMLTSLYQDETRRTDYSGIFLAGCAGGVAQLSIACPIELIKVKMQTQMAGQDRFR